MSNYIVKTHPVLTHKTVSIQGSLKKSSFHFDLSYVQHIEGTTVRGFFRKPTPASIEVLNALSLWNGPDRELCNNKGLYGWEFTVEKWYALRKFILVVNSDFPIDRFNNNAE